MPYVKGSIYSVPMRMAFGAMIERRFLITEEDDKDEQARGHVLQARVAIMQRHLIQKERHQQIKFKTCGI